MAIDTQEITGTTTSTLLEDADPILTHIVGPQGKMSGAALVTQAMVNGTAVTALCGHTWVPSRNPENHPPCPPCLEIVAFAKDMRR